MSLQEQRSQLEAQRAQLEARKSELTPYKEKISQAEQENIQAKQTIEQNRANALSQRSLRAQTGVGGLNARRKTLNVLQENQNVLGQRETQVGEYKTQVLEAESQLDSAIAQVDDSIDDINDYELAQKFYEKKVPYQFVDDDRVRSYLKEMYQQGSAIQEGMNKAIQTYNTTGKLPDNLQKAFDKYTAKGFSEEKAFKLLGFNIQPRDQAGRPTSGNDIRIETMNLESLPPVDAQSKVNILDRENKFLATNTFTNTTSYINPFGANVTSTKTEWKPGVFVNGINVSKEANDTNIQPDIKLIGTIKGTPIYNISDGFELTRSVNALEQPQGILEKWQSDLDRKGRSGDRGPASGFISPVLGTLIFAKDVLTSPVSTTKNLVKGVGNKAVEFKDYFFNNGPSPGESIGRTLRDEPGYSTGRVIGEVLLFKGLGEVAPRVSKVVENTATILSPKFRPVLETAEGTRTIQNIPSNVPGRNVLSIPIQERLPTQTLASQAELAGTTQDLVSGSRDLFGNIINRERMIRKPIANEESLSASTKSMLKQFDEGTLSPSRFEELNRRVVQETGSKGILERSFFADPLGRLRPSRLGLEGQRTATFSDILSGDVSMTRARPQAIFFEQQRISNFPKSLSDVETALKSGRPLTAEQTRRFNDWQLTRTNEFKPVGFLSRESETTLSPGNIIKREATPASTIIRYKGKPGIFGDILFGNRVPIIRSNIITPSDEVSELLNKASVFGLSSDETIKLNKLLKSETGFDYSSYAQPSKPYLSPATALSPILSNAPSKTYETSSEILSSPTSSSTASPKSLLSASSIKSEFSQKPTSKVSSPSSFSSKISFLKSLISTSGKSKPRPSSSGSPTPRQSPRPYLFRSQNKDYNKKESKSKGYEKLFKIFKKIKGKDTFIGTATSEREAGGFLKKSLKSDLSASGFVTDDFGRKIKAKNLGLDWDFRVGKRDPFKLVQKSGGSKEGGSSRLSTRPEINEIQFLKRKRKKLSIWE